MKQLLLILFLLLFTFSSTAQNVGINTIGAVPDNSAILDLNSFDKGFLVTRADTANINSPAFGLMTLAPIDSCLYMYNGVKWVGLGGAGSNCSCNCNNSGSTSFVFPCNGTVIPVIEVTNSITGKIWMDRNLGASQVATSSTDAAAYGDLYQWGRCSDGHEKRTSSLTSTLSLNDDPGHGDFITNSTAPNDWRNPPNANLWQGVSGINNPCPTGYRLPTETELDAEHLSWTSNNAAGAFNSPLKLTVAGNRDNNGAISLAGNFGFYWSSSASVGSAFCLGFDSNIAFSAGACTRGMAASVRCIKD